MTDLDEELTSQIKTVFDNFDDGGSDMGWTQLRTKYPKKSVSKLPLYWFGGIAASLLVVFGLWFLKKPVQLKEENQFIVVHQEDVKPIIEKPVVQQKDTATIKSKEQVAITHTLGEPTTNLAPQLNTTQKQSIVKANPVPPTAIKEKIDLPVDAVQIEQNRVAQIKSEAQKSNPPIGKTETLPNQVIVAKVENQKTNPQVNNGQFDGNPITNSNKIDTGEVMKNDQQVAKNAIKASIEPLVQKKTTEEFLKEQSKLAGTKVEQKEKKEKNNKNSYEVFTGTFLNYYANNDVKVNAGFGLNANLKVSKGLFLSVGAGISQNQISSQTNAPPASPKDVQSIQSFASPSSTTSLKSEVVTNVKLSAQLLSLDLPISLKFYPSKKQNFYFSTGLNSNSYFTQKYDYTYTVVSASSLLSTSKIAREETEKSKFKGFDLANSALFAIGVTQRIGKTNNLIFEPYFKPAIGNMGDKNLKINTVGLNLKFSFNNADKK